MVVLKREWYQTFWQYCNYKDSIRNRNEKALSEKSDEIEENLTKHGVHDNYVS